MFQKFVQKKTYSRILVAFIVGVMIMATMSIASVKANPINVTVSPTSGPVGTVVTVSGDDATAGGEVRVYVAIFIVSFFAATTTANSTGDYSVNITVPAFPEDIYSIVVLDVETGDMNMATFTIESSITLNNEEGSYNDEVIVKGHGFDSDVLITLTFDGDDVTPTPQPETDDFGSFEARIRVPMVPKGTYTVTADDGSNTASASFTVIPKLTVSPTSGPKSTIVYVNGTGFASSVGVSVMFGAVNVTMYPSFPTNLDGSFMQLFLVPDVADGTYTVNATDASGSSATAPFIKPSPIMTVTPNTTSGPALVTVNGFGLPPNTPILVHFEDILAVSLMDLMVKSEVLFTDEYGSYEYSFIVPVAKPGVYTVAAYQVVGGGFTTGEKLASASLTIVEDALLSDIKDDLTAIEARLVSIEGNVATINSTIGLIETDIANIQLNVTAINGNVATIQTALGTIQGRITSIEGSTATIETDVGTVKTDISHIKGSQETLTIPFYVTLVMALIAAVGAIALLVMHIQAMRRTAKP